MPHPKLGRGLPVTPSRRQWQAAHPSERCKAVVMLKDKSTADCMRRVLTGKDRCWQHDRMESSK